MFGSGFRRLFKSEAFFPVAAACAGLAVCILLDRLYVTPIVTADAPSYLSAAEGGWGRMYRTPAYGYVLRLGLLFGTLKFVVWTQVALWCAMVAALAFVTGRLLRSPALGGVVALSLVAYEVQHMSFLPYHWHLLTESLLTSVLLLGLLGLVFAALQNSARVLLASVALLGFVVWLKPLPIPLLIAAPFIVAVLRPRASHVRSLRLTLFAFFLLCAPIATVSLYNAVAFGSLSPSSVAGLDLLSHAEALYREGDVVFDDAALNSQFAEVMRTGTYAQKEDFVGFPHEHAVWGAMRAFFDDHSGETEGGHRVYAIDRISKQVAWSLIRLHPWDYARNVWSKSLGILTLEHADDLPWRNGMRGIVQRQRVLLAQMSPDLLAPFDGLADPAFTDMDARVVTWVNSIRLLSEEIIMSSAWRWLQVIFLTISFVVAWTCVRSSDRARRCSGTLLFTLLLTGALITLCNAMFVFIDDNDSRYRVQAAACFAVAVFLSIAILLQNMLSCRDRSSVPE